MRRFPEPGSPTSSTCSRISTSETRQSAGRPTRTTVIVGEKAHFLVCPGELKPTGRRTPDRPLLEGLAEMTGPPQRHAGRLAGPQSELALGRYWRIEGPRIGEEPMPVFGYRPRARAPVQSTSSTVPRVRAVGVVREDRPCSFIPSRSIPLPAWMRERPR